MGAKRCDDERSGASMGAQIRQERARRLGGLPSDRSGRRPPAEPRRCDEADEQRRRRRDDEEHKTPVLEALQGVRHRVLKVIERRACGPAQSQAGRGAHDLRQVEYLIGRDAAGSPEQVRYRRIGQ